MRKALGVACALGALLFGFHAFAQTPYSQMPKRRNLTLTYTCTLTDIPADARELNLWLPLPPSNDRQKIRLLSTDLQGGRITFDKTFKNRMLYRHLILPSPALHDGTLTTTLNYEAEIWEKSVPVAGALPSTRQVTPGKAYRIYLGNTKLIPLTGPITDVANQIVLPQGEPLRTGRKIYDYLADNMVYNKQAVGAGNGDAAWACTSKTGDCSDYHSVFIGVCRAQGIPADHIFGLALDPDKSSGQIAGFHCWVRFWVAGLGWIPIDASEASKHPDQRDYLFGSLSTRCIELSHGRDVVLNPPQKGEPVNMFVGPVAEVDGKPFKNIHWNCAYRTVSGSVTSGEGGEAR